MAASLIAQISALCRKNWTLMWRHKWSTIWRCILYQLIYASYLAQTQTFYKGTGNYGPGKAVAMQPLDANLLGLKLVVATASQDARDFVATALSAAGVSGTANVVHVDSPDQVTTLCPENFNAISPCFAGLVVENLDTKTGHLNYTLRGDFGVTQLNVPTPKNDDLQKRFLPLQWALESTWINKTTGHMPTTPEVWGYTHLTQKEYDEKARKDFVRSLRGFMVVPYIIAWLGILYHIPAKMAAERMSKLTEHLDVMGCRASARLISWHFSVSAAHALGWIATGAIYGGAMFKHVNIGYFIVSFILFGLLLASWSMLVAAPFARYPTIAAITSCGLGVLFAIVGQVVGSKAAAQVVLTLLLPPTYIIWIFRSAASFELLDTGLNILKKSPDGDAPQLACMVMAAAGALLYPVLACLVEWWLYDIRPTQRPHGFSALLNRGKWANEAPIPPDVAVRISHLRKTYTSRTFGVFGAKKETVAIEDLSLDVLRGEILCLLGRNGAAKSTTLGAISGLVSTTSGSVKCADDLRLGVASQADVLWDDLTCEQHVRLWSRIKSGNKVDKAFAGELLERVGLAKKITALAKTLSGGQKRKLALACALAGGSDLLLLDEVSSGLDPISRRAIWRVIAGIRSLGATVVLTTHFLDEADYLGDTIAIMRAPGRLLALDGPVPLKASKHGFSIVVQDPPAEGQWSASGVLDRLKRQDPGAYMKSTRGKIVFGTTGDMAALRACLCVLQAERRVGVNLKYQVSSTTLEEVFLDLNEDKEGTAGADTPTVIATPDHLKAFKSVGSGELESGVMELRMRNASPRRDALYLTPGRQRGWYVDGLAMAMAVTHKRIMILSRSFILPLAAIIVVLIAACVPLTFLKGRNQTCSTAIFAQKIRPMTFPASEYATKRTPPLIAVEDTALANWTSAIGSITSVPFANFAGTLTDNRKNFTYGGVSIPSSGAPTVAFMSGEENDEFTTGISVLNLFSNAAFQQIEPASDAFRITANWQWIPSPFTSAFGKAIEWFVFFGLAMAVWPAFAALYPTWEKTSQVRSNQYSNGARPSALWLGHLTFEMPGVLFIATVLTIAYAAVNQFHGLGYFWLCIVLYGIAATLWAFVASLMFKTSLAAWAFVAFVNAIVFLLYLTMYMLLLTFDKSPNAGDHLLYAHLGFSAVNPLGSLLRAAFISLNMWNLLCDGIGKNTTKSLGDITLYGGPIVYMIVQAALAFLVLVYVDTGRPVPRWLRMLGKKLRFRRRDKRNGHHRHLGSRDSIGAEEQDAEADDRRDDMADVMAEKHRVTCSDDALQVVNLTKKFRSMPVPSVDDVSFGVAQGETFALIGPNGAGKTTTLACIRGVEKPTDGDVIVRGASIIDARNKARSSLGVCPQVNALDTHMTVRQHLWLYGRLKGVPRADLARDVAALLAVSGLDGKADALAPTLSGGNQRKLSLAIALIGDRPIVLIDEFSSGVDPFSKREAWATLEALTAQRAVVMTTHSMEEVDALASRVGIIAAHMLAIGTPSALKSRFATYEIHVPAAHVEGVLAHLHAHGFPRAHPSPDTATRISVPGVNEAQLDALLAVLQGLGTTEMTLHEASTEAAFLSIVNKHNVREDMFHEQRLADQEGDKKKKKHWWSRKKRGTDEE